MSCAQIRFKFNYTYSYFLSHWKTIAECFKIDFGDFNILWIDYDVDGELNYSKFKL